MKPTERDSFLDQLKVRLITLDGRVILIDMIGNKFTIDALFFHDPFPSISNLGSILNKTLEPLPANQPTDPLHSQRAMSAPRLPGQVWSWVFLVAIEIRRWPDVFGGV